MNCGAPIFFDSGSLALSLPFQSFQITIPILSFYKVDDFVKSYNIYHKIVSME